MKKTMADAVALTNYLRDYIWSIGVDRMRPAAGEGAPPFPLVPQNAPSTPPATTGAEAVGRQAATRRPASGAAAPASPVNGSRR